MSYFILETTTSEAVALALSNLGRCFNPKKAGLFEGSLFWGKWKRVNLILLHISKKTYLISIQLYTIVKQSIESMLKIKMLTSSDIS